MLSVLDRTQVTGRYDYSVEQTKSMFLDGREKVGYTYGVRVLDISGMVIWQHHDISPDKRIVEGFVQLLVERDVAPIHIHDVLEDYLP